MMVCKVIGKEVIKMYCGIDVSKDKSNVCILDKDKKIIVEFEIRHNKEGFEKLEQHLTQDTTIAMETTSSYCRALYSFLKGKYQVSYVDNVQMKNFTRLHHPHRKNDRVDARSIAEYLTFDFKKINPVKNDELKDLVRLYYKSVKQLSRHKHSFKSQLSIIFPELEKNFYIKRTKAVAYMLIKYPTPKAIAEATDEEIYQALIEKLNKTSKFTPDYAKRLRAVAKESVGVIDYPTSCFLYTLKLLLFYQDLVDDLKKKMEEKVKETPYGPLLNEYGYNAISLSSIVGEIGDVRRFSNHKKFVKYIGLDVSEKQSGSSQSVNCYITKQGNKYLRHLFYNMVLNHLAYKTKYAEFFYRLKESGKHAKKCMVATARKLAIRAYFDLLKCHNQ
ncbi:IS110 family transposase [Candidatus Woesearchaeota archaeon]|nr:IS110 family transposase [Candidatus Woesearchaeota archaeon]